MTYIPAPFKTNVKYQDQVKTELNLANDNFTLLGQAFLNNDPTQPILRAVYISSSAPASPVADMLWYDTSSNILKLYDGNTWQAINDFSSLSSQINTLNSQVSTINSNVNTLNSQVNTLNSDVNTLNSAFLNNDPTKTILRATYIGSTAPTNPAEGTTWLDTSTTPTLKVYDGSAWQVASSGGSGVGSSSNADTVDGFHASLTPAPNTIIPLNTDGILDLSSTYIKSDVYTFRRVDLTNATSDYLLQVGEEAIINFTNTTTVPLYIATQSGTLYNLYIYLTAPSFALNSGAVRNAASSLLPNNTSYSSVFYRSGIVRDNNGGAAAISGSTSAFNLTYDFYPANCFSIIYNEKTHKSIMSWSVHGGYDTNNFARSQKLFSVWADYSTQWTSLGTINFPTSSSGYILVRRLV